MKHNRPTKIHIIESTGRAHKVLPLYFYALILSIIMLSSCAPAAKTVRVPSTEKKPTWIDHPPQSSDILYFIGISTAANTLEEGRGTALNNALTKVSGYLGSKIKSVFEGHFTEMEHSLREQIRSKSAATVHGAHVVDTYHEKIITKGKEEDVEKFDVYVLVSFSKEEAAKEMVRQQKAKEEAVKRAYEYFDTGMKLEGEHKFYDARVQYRQAKDAMKEIDELIEINAKRNSEELKLKLTSHLEDMDSKLKRISLKVKVNAPDEGKKMFETNLASALNRYGFTVSDEYPAFTVTGEVTVKESSFIMNSYAYFAEGSITAVRTTDNQKFAVYPFKVKGFHRTREQASINALKEAGLESGGELSRLIKKKQAILDY